MKYFCYYFLIYFDIFGLKSFKNEIFVGLKYFVNEIIFIWNIYSLDGRLLTDCTSLPITDCVCVSKYIAFRKHILLLLQENVGQNNLLSKAGNMIPDILLKGGSVKTM